MKDHNIKIKKLALKCLKQDCMNMKYKKEEENQKELKTKTDIGGVIKLDLMFYNLIN